MLRLDMGKTLVPLLLLAFVFQPTARAAVQIVENGEFLEDEVSFARDGDTWLAVIDVNDKDVVQEVKISVKPTDDGRKVLTSHADAIFLFRGLKVKPGEVQGALIDEPRLPPGESTRVAWNRDAIVLSATGKIEAGETDELIKNYELVLTAQKKRFVLAKAPELTDGPFEIKWIGDLNRDGSPDLLIDVSDLYGVRRPTLFLSPKYTIAAEYQATNE